MKNKVYQLLVLVLILVVLSACSNEAGRGSSSGPVASPTHSGHQHTPTAHPAKPDDAKLSPLLGNLGKHTHPITTKSALAQKYFDEGLILTYGFNHVEAIRSFKDALKLDPTCAMCYWGIANALGPNINAPMADEAVPQAWEALQKAIALSANASAVERDYIQSLAVRYVAEPVVDRSGLDKNYANAMRELAKKYPNDNDAATLYAEALMDLSPWNYWTKDGQPTEYTEEIVAVLEEIMRRDTNHPGANHLYIHAVEASQTPERALPSARRIEEIAPGAGHLVHMAAHIYWRTGMYEDAIRINERAIKVDEASRVVGGTPDNSTHNFYYLSYYPHNIHFVFAGAQMSGQSEKALQFAKKLVANVPDEAIRAVPPLEDFKPMPLFALVRFGRWDEILKEAAPAVDMQYTMGIWHWARGLAFTRQGQFDKAASELKELQAIAKSEAMQKLTLASFPQASTLLTLAAHVLAGELAGAKGDLRTAIAELEAAVAIQDELAYIEPPAWFYPVRQNLGALLMQAGQIKEAEVVYRKDLQQYPLNGWSLFGLAESLKAQGKLSEAQDAQARFQKAFQNADVTLKASRY